MPTFESLSSMQRYIEKATIASLEYEVANVVEETIRKYLYNNFYAYQPKVYQRTFEFFNSLTKSRVVKNGDEYEVQVYFDTDKIHANPQTGQHYDGEDISEYIPWMAEDGVIQPFQSNHRGGFVQDAFTELESLNIHINALKEALREKGITVI